MKKAIVFFAASVILFAACNAIETRINDKADIEKGTKVAGEFIENIKAKNYEKAMEHTKLKPGSVDYETHVADFKSINAKLGDIVEFKQDTAYSTYAQEGAGVEGTITIRYSVKYTGGATKETYIMADSDDEVKIMSYNIVNE